MEKEERPEFTVRATRQARDESRPGRGLFETWDELMWVVRQCWLLKHWPIDPPTRDAFALDLDFSRIDFGGVTFYELRLDDAALARKNLRVFFYVDDRARTVWIVFAYWKKTQRIEKSVLTRVARRVHDLRGALQDGD